MRKWLRRGGVVVLLIGLTLGILFETSSHVVRGWLRGEAFYDGRPTSYWRIKLTPWKVVYGHKDCWYEREESWSGRNLLTWIVGIKSDEQRFDEIMEQISGPRILHAEDSKAVLLELLADSSPNIRCLARIGLKMGPE